MLTYSGPKFKTLWGVRYPKNDNIWGNKAAPEGVSPPTEALTDNLSHQGADPMQHITNQTEQVIAGDYGQLRITYRRTRFAWDVTVYQGTLRIDELCGAWDNASAAYREAQRIARAAHDGISVDQIIAEKPSELALAAVKALLDTVPAGDHRQVRPTMAHAHLAPLAAAQLRAVRIAGESTSHVVYAGEATRATLQSLARKGYGVLNYQPGLGRRRVVESLTLNERGVAEVLKSGVAA
jgi:hypothetical protein